MATTMRGFLRLGLRPPNFHWSSSGPLTACNLSRPLHLLQTHLRCTFTTSSCQWAAKKSRLPHSVSSTAFKSVLPYKSPFNAYTEQLANRASPTLLYEAPSHNFYNTGWLLMGAFCLTWAIINFKHQYLHPVEGTPKFIPYMMGAACVGMMFGAGWSFSKPGRIIRTITAIPSSIGSGHRSLRLQIEHTPLLPGKQIKSLLVAPSDVEASDRIYGHEAKRSEAEMAEIRRRQDHMRELDRTRIMTRPFRQARYLSWKGFVGFRKFVGSENFIYVRIKGKNGVWKLDRNAAWSFEEGKAIDRLIKCTPSTH